MATRKTNPKAKPARKAAARKPVPKAASKKTAPKKPAAKVAARKVAAPKVAAPTMAVPKTAAPKLPPKWTATQKSEFDAIQARAKALSPVLKRTDFDADGNALPGPWASMLADLHAWARKHKVTLESHEHDHAPTAGGDAPAGATPYGYGGECPGSFTKVERKKIYDVTYTFTYNCTLRRQTVLGRCVYDCTGNYTI